MPAAVPIRRPLLAWFDRQKRDLPWRIDSDPYRVWVSEVMLQQTTVATVIPYYQRFLGRFPSLRDLASAELESVLEAWSGLGYYRRARFLHQAARLLVDRGGELPASSAAWRELPGIGDYTAAAIASIAHAEPTAVVDGNVIRVLTRLCAWSGDPTKEPLRSEIERLAHESIDRDRPGDFNQALMELGATVCTPHSPRCDLCPLRDGCRARKDGTVEQFPQLPARARAVPVQRVAALVVDRRGQLLLRRIPESERNAGLLEFPSIEIALPPRSERIAWDSRFRREAQKRFRSVGLRLRCGDQLDRLRHTITRYRIDLLLVAGEATAPLPRGPGWRRASLSEIERLALTSATRKLVARMRRLESKRR